MITQRTTPVIAGTFLLMAFGPSALAEDLLTNRLLAAQCAQCHGTNGHAVGDMESIAGEDDLYDELQEMLLEGEPNDIMAHQAQGYSDEQMRRISAHFATQAAGSNRESED